MINDVYMCIYLVNEQPFPKLGSVEPYPPHSCFVTGFQGSGGFRTGRPHSAFVEEQLGLHMMMQPVCLAVFRLM